MKAAIARAIGAGLCLGLIAAVLPIVVPSAAAQPAPPVDAPPAPTPTLSFTAAPTAADPAAAFAVAPAVEVTDSTAAVTLSLVVDAGQPSGKLTCTQLTVTPVDGVATFEGCAVDKGGRYLLRATLGAVTADSASLLVSGPAYVSFSTQPTGGLAGETWLGQPVASVVDGDGAVIDTSTAKVGLVIKPGTGVGGAAIACTNTNNATLAVAGVATFEGCTIDRAGADYQLYAIDVDDGVFGTSAPFDISAGPAAALQFDTQPGSGTAAAALSAQPVVAIVDSEGNRVASSTAAVTLTLTSGTGASGAAVTCASNPASAATGLATFDGCAVDLAGGDYTLTASSPSLTSAVSASFDVTAGGASTLAFTTSPSGGPGGAPFATQPVVTALDAGGNAVGGLVGLSIKPGTGAPGAVLTCDATSVVATVGAAEFSGCSIDLASPDAYVLVATLGSALTADSDGFDITNGAPASAEFTTDPSDGTGGSAFTTQPAVVVRDAGGNVAAGAVTLALAPGFGTPDATLACDGGNTVSTVGGTATFTGCRVDRAGPGYRLLATVSGSTASDVSASFDVTVGAATQLAFTTSPGGGTGGTSWAVQPVVAVLDAGGNTVADAAVAVDLAVASGPGRLECASDPLAVVSGSAFFTGCSIDVAGAGYTLTAAATGLTSTTSTPFDVTVGAPSELRFAAQPSSGTAGQALTGQPALVVVDAGGNAVPSAGGIATIAITAGTGTAGASLSCSTAPVDATGAAAFAGCAVNQAGGGYALTATWNAFVAESLPFVVLPTTAPPLEVAPAGAPVGQTIGDASLAPNPTSVVDDVNTATGALHHVFSDLQVAGVGHDLVVERTYNSNDTVGGAFGRGFSSIFDLSVTFNAAGTEATVRGPDGQRVVFTGHQGSFTPGPGVQADLKCTGNQKTCTVSQWDGTTWTVTGAQLDSYTDANGEGLSFVRNSATQTTVKLATTEKKTTYDVVVTMNTTGQITKIKTPANREVSYGYTAGRLTSFTDARGKVWTYNYDAGSRLTHIIDPTNDARLIAAYDPTSGRVATASIKGSARHTENRYTYDPAAQATTREARTSVGGQLAWAPYVDTYRNNVLVRQTFPTGSVVRYSYDTRLNLLAIQDPNGFVQERVFNAAGDLITERTPINSTQSAVVQFTYDGNHRMVTQTDPNGNQTKYGYGGGNVNSVTPPGSGNGATKLKYDGHGLLTEIETPIGSQTFAYDTVGNQVRVNELGPSGPAINGNGSRTTYNEAGQATAYTDARGVPTSGAVNPSFTTTWTYDNAGNLLSTRSPVGVVTTFTYDNAADVVSTSNPGGTTTYVWNEAALARTTNAPGGAVTTQTYDPSGNVLAETSPSGGTTTYTYDALGRGVTTTDPAGTRTAVTYDATSNAVLIDDGAGRVVRQQFDSMNRLIRRAGADDQTLFSYDLAGNVVRVQDGGGAVTQRTYDSHRNVASVTDAAGTTTYQYDLADNVAKRIDGRNRATTFTYDGMSRLTSETVAGNTTTYTNDVAGQRIKMVDPEGRLTALTLDGANRTTKTIYTQTGQPSITVDEAYDWQDRRTSMTSAGVTSTYSYDARGNLTGAGPASQRFAYDYSQPGQVVETYPDGTAVTYEVDDAGALMRLDGSSASGDVQASYLRDADRRPTAIALSNGVLQSRSYDVAGHITAQSVQHLGTVLAGETYTYDGDGNRLSQRTTAAGRSVLNAYKYDTLGRISGFSASTTAVPEPVVDTDPDGATSTPPAALGLLPVPASFDTGSPQPDGTPVDAAVAPATNIAYDAVGNIVNLEGTGFNHDNADQITTQTAPNATWTFDRSGAVTKMLGANGTTTFAYDAAGRLARATVQPPAGSAITVTYGYDGDGNRISRTVGGVTTQYGWDPNASVPQLVLEQSGGVVQRRYFNDERGPVAMQTPTETYYFHRDPLGTTNQLTDSSGAVVAAYSYDAFGAVSAVGPAAAVNDILFQGQQLDPATGLYNMRARNYDPNTGRFTQREPLATPVGAPLITPYAFVGNRPTVFTDPTGLMPDLQAQGTTFVTAQVTAAAAKLASDARTEGTAAGAKLESVAHTQTTQNANITNDAKLATTGLKLGVKGAAKVGVFGATVVAEGASPAERALIVAKNSKIKGAGIALSIVGIGLQAYVTAENCQHGPVEKCVASAVGLAVNVAFTAGCLVVTSAVGSVVCSIGGMILGVGLEYVIAEYGPEIADALVTFGALTTVGVGIATEAIFAGVLVAADEIANAATAAGGAIVSGFNDAGAAISSGYQGFVDTLNQAGPTAVQLGNTIADNFGFAYDQTAAALIGLGYDIQGVAEAFGAVFLLSAEQAAAVLRDTFSAGAAEVAAALESAYDATAAEVAAALRDAGYAVDEIVNAIDDAYAVTMAELVGILADLDYGFNQIAGALSDVLDVTAEAMAEVLKSLDYTVQQVAEALQQIYDLADGAAAAVLAGVEFAVGEVADALQDVYKDTAALAAKVLQDVYDDVVAVATGLRDAYQATAAQVTQILKGIEYTAIEVAGALVDVYTEVALGVASLLQGAGYVVDDVAGALSDVFDETIAGVAGILRDVGYAINDITRVLDDVFNQGVAAIAGILGDIGYTVSQIGATLQSVLSVTADAIAGVLRDLGYSIEQIGSVLQSVYNQAAEQAAAILRNVGYAVQEIGAVLQDVFHQAAAGAAAILRSIGATAAEIAGVLEDTFNQSVDAIGNLLSSIGFNSDTISAIGGAFEDFGDDVADFFDDLF